MKQKTIDNQGKRMKLLFLPYNTFMFYFLHLAIYYIVSPILLSKNDGTINCKILYILLFLLTLSLINPIFNSLTDFFSIPVNNGTTCRIKILPRARLQRSRVIVFTLRLSCFLKCSMQNYHPIRTSSFYS